MLLRYPEAHRQLVRRLAAVLSPQGRYVARFFCLPEQPESPSQVLDDLLCGRISHLNILKLRLFAALQESAEQGVAVHDVWTVVHQRAGGDWTGLARSVSWPMEEFNQLDLYRNSQARYTVLSRHQARTLFEQEGKFRCLGIRVGNYPLADRCPVFGFARE